MKSTFKLPRLKLLAYQKELTVVISSQFPFSCLALYQPLLLVLHPLLKEPPFNLLFDENVDSLLVLHLFEVQLFNVNFLQLLLTFFLESVPLRLDFRLMLAKLLLENESKSKMQRSEKADLQAATNRCIAEFFEAENQP